MISSYTDAELEQEIYTEETYLAELKTERLSRSLNRSSRRLPTPDRILSIIGRGIRKRAEIAYELTGVSQANLDIHLRRLREEGFIRSAGYGLYEIVSKEIPGENLEIHMSEETHVL
jgi:DNA-binding transcriptional ArsR family regulator